MFDQFASQVRELRCKFLAASNLKKREKLTKFKGVFRGALGAGEAICFGVDSIAVPFIKEAGVIFAFYATGVMVFYYLALTQIKETECFNGEDDVVILKHVLEEHVIETGGRDEESRSVASERQEEVKGGERIEFIG